MTEEQWLTCVQPTQMLGFLRTSGKFTERKARLFAVACCRRIWPLLSDERSRTAVEVAERYADGLVSEWERTVAWAMAKPVAHDFWLSARVNDHPDSLVLPVGWEPIAGPAEARRAFPGAYTAAIALGPPTLLPKAADWAAEAAERAAMPGDEREEQSRLLRDMVGPLPFRLPPLVAPAWLTWNGSTVGRLAEAAYQERELPGGTLDPDRLAVLADALEEAGCADAELLGHLRSTGPHVRGCFAVDAILGRE
jgi:hypothetical protein